MMSEGRQTGFTFIYLFFVITFICRFPKLSEIVINGSLSQGRDEIKVSVAITVDDFVADLLPV